jgi:hypothetical protein
MSFIPTSPRRWAAHPQLIRTIATSTHAVRANGCRLAVLLTAVTAASLAPTAAQAAPAAPESPDSPDVALALSVTDTPGAILRTATLHCRGSQEVAGGYLSQAPEEACKQARSLAEFLLSTPDPTRRCPLPFAGQQTAEVTGFVNGHRVRRAFSRHDGCAIADWDRMGLLLNAAISPSRLLIAYHRSGGFFFHDDRLSVANSGLAIATAHSSLPRVFQLSGADLSDLQRALQIADFPSLKSKYLPPFDVADGFTYTLTHNTNTVLTADGAIPAVLEALITVLNRLLDAPPA